jgi:hypothetical protein
MGGGKPFGIEQILIYRKLKNKAKRAKKRFRRQMSQTKILNK